MKKFRMFSKLTKVVAVVAMTMGSLTGATSAKDVISPDLMKAKDWRFVGPFRGGRVTTVTGVVGNDQLYYTGAAGGGVFKTENAGLTWENISDDYFGVGTIGAIAVSKSDTNVLYVGTGEAPIRGVTSSDGDGVYKSTDAGQTWTHVGLRTVGQISRIIVHPTNPDIAWVGAQGQIWAENEDRGVFKTIDGGKTWKHTLKVAPDTGVGEMTIDPTNPRILYSAMWQNGRKAWFIKSGGTSGGIFKSTDGGETWDKLGGGLPEMIGKVGIDVVASQPSRVYAIVEAEEGKGGAYRSDDYGKTWKLMNDTRFVQTRAWYYNRITADPSDPDTVYISNVTFIKSSDGGKTWKRVRTAHGDYHDHWVNPINSKNMINASDGGASITFDGGKSWSSIYNQPTAQFYRVTTDNQVPYRIYGGQQDNSTVAILSETYGSGIGAGDFFAVGGGESAHIAFDPENPRFVYATTINNTLTEYDTSNSRLRPIKPYPEYVFGKAAEDIHYRANWNAPIAANKIDPSIIYYGTHKLIRTADRGVNWEEISGDLTRNDKSKQGLNGGPITNESVGAEYYGTIFYIETSPHEKDVIWTGSDDGLVYLTRDEGKSWSNVTPKGAPEGLINAIEVSPYDPATAYVVVAAYKENDFRPYIYRTTNYGKSWKRLDKGLPKETFVRVVREDPVRKGLLYVGTEKGMYVSFDDGKNWQAMRLNMPPVPITDLDIRQGDLIAATQGRGFWVMDDLSYYRQLTGNENKADMTAFTPSPARLATSGGWGGGSGAPSASNPPRGVVLNYFLKEAAKGELTIDIMDSAGSVIRRFSNEESDSDRCKMGNQPPRMFRQIQHPSKKQGMNSWTWDMRQSGVTCIPNHKLFAGWDGRKVLPGDYSARIRVDGHTETVPITLQQDPRVEATKVQFTGLANRIDATMAMMNELVDSLEGLRKSRTAIIALMKEYDDVALHNVGNSAVKQITDWENLIIQVKFRAYEDEDSWPSMFDFQVRHLIDALDRAGPPVSNGSVKRFDDLTAQWAGYAETRDAIISGDIKTINDWVSAKGINLVRQ